MTQRDLAGKLDINVKTLRKRKKDRPKVYRLLMIGLKAENALVSFKENIEARAVNPKSRGRGICNKH